MRINAIANGYKAWVFDVVEEVMDKASMLYIAPDALDLTAAVKAELGIK